MRRTLTGIAVVLALLAAACAGSDDPTAATGGAADEPSDVATTEPAEVAEPTTTAADDAKASPAAPEPGGVAQLRVRHPETLAFAAPFTLFDSTGPLEGLVEDIDVATWSTPDVLRSMLVNGQSEVTAVPTYVGANLSNRGVDVRVAAVVVWGLLWLIGPEDAEPSWEALRGQTLMVPFRNDMPDLVLRYLAAANGLTVGEDFEIEYYAQTPEVVGRLVSGEGTWAVLPEHVATVALAQAGQNGQSLGRVLDLQQEWAAAAGTSPRIPQAGIVVPGALADDHPDVVGAVLDELEQSVATVNAADADTVAALSEASGVPAPLVEQVIPRLNLEVVPGGEAREELETFYSELASLSPEIIGGKLPDASFYLDDPR